MAVLEVNGLCKSYASFQLKDVSFALDAGTGMTENVQTNSKTTYYKASAY